jgi:hypothetical protein
MMYISQINDDPKQSLSLVIDGYARANMLLEFKPNQYAWFYTLSWNGFVTNQELLSNAPNLLRQYRNQLPFGLLLDTTGGADPMSQDAFITTSSLYLLSAAEVLEVEQELYGV